MEKKQKNYWRCIRQILQDGVKLNDLMNLINFCHGCTCRKDAGDYIFFPCPKLRCLGILEADGFTILSGDPLARFIKDLGIEEEIGYGHSN